MAKQIVENSALKLKDLDAIAFSCGPGSFTGLRIAAGVAQGLAYGLGCSIFPISNLKAMALQCYKQSGEKNILVALDARMNEVYWSVCQIDISGRIPVVETCNGEHVSTPESVTLPDEIKVSRFAGVGSGFNFLARFPLDVQQRMSCLDANARPKADEVCELALNAIQQGVSGDLVDAMPSYIRDKVTWQKLPGRE